MKILFLAPGLLYSQKRPFEKFKQLGTESEIYGISKELAKIGHDVYVIGRFRELSKTGHEIIEGVKFIDIKMPHLKDEIIYETGSLLLYSKLAMKTIKNINPDIINLNDRFSAYFVSKLNIPMTFVTHNPDAMEFYKDFSLENNFLNKYFFPFKKKIEEEVLSRSNMIIALNSDIQNYLYKKGFTNISLIPNGIDANKYRNEGDDNYILFAGRYNKVKGIEYLLQSFLRIHQNFSTTLLLVGSGTEEESIKKFTTTNNMEHKVKFVSTLDKIELRECLSKCSLFVLPSLFECMPVTLLEAMASGKTVIASDIAGPNDIIKHGHNGFLFEKQNTNELKKLLELCLSDKKLREKIGTNARTTIEEKYTFKQVAQQYIDNYEHIFKMNGNIAP
ncbi:glycosyltransferase involved in cell wall biosynthesis [Methanohalophilus euhalobius]|uniref:Glycosyltransferase involved in cell wall biosynthesis n=1 Tax=Methanohalophilus euhalobius TaxID=51203 RepID=A0A285GDU0_9EURY|nr:MULTISPECIES: glycosyltransferase family 4 protein [Methanohalophilus]ODV48846.1 MAG: glycosyltransferase [Methanohalophilus sp. 2-GBenrich]TCL11595.1 glycosyltransferase involved in cell wall biosynthesis [Methanohalophilus euhalobius]SNY20656.1 Glycosyltransferase involved in cell wall bisynthesis [Methanohalophilus euhalobius]